MKDEPPFNPLAIRITEAIQWVVAGLLAWYSIVSQQAYYQWIIPSMLLVALIGMKVAAPKLPIHQVAAATAFVWLFPVLTLLLIDHLQFSPLLYLFGDFVIPIICVVGFGRYWVSKKYIPKSSNWWPR